ncbi:hypothetical protein DL771_008345 [Monosporascus sp. 5C6A]|nr:hypothetical protein DL771_008345 [Monosporascus sp. 5C6A]
MATLDYSAVFLVVVTLAAFLVPILLLFPPGPVQPSDLLAQTHSRLGLSPSQGSLLTQHSQQEHRPRDEHISSSAKIYALYILMSFHERAASVSRAPMAVMALSTPTKLRADDALTPVKMMKHMPSPSLSPYKSSSFTNAAALRRSPSMNPNLGSKVSKSFQYSTLIDPSKKYSLKDSRKWLLPIYNIPSPASPSPHKLSSRALAPPVIDLISLQQGPVTSPAPGALQTKINFLDWQLKLAKKLAHDGDQGPLEIGDFLCKIDEVTGEVQKEAIRMLGTERGCYCWFEVSSKRKYSNP